MELQPREERNGIKSEPVDNDHTESRDASNSNTSKDAVDWTNYVETNSDDIGQQEVVKPTNCITSTLSDSTYVTYPIRCRFKQCHYFTVVTKNGRNSMRNWEGNTFLVHVQEHLIELLSRGDHQPKWTITQLVQYEMFDWHQWQGTINCNKAHILYMIYSRRWQHTVCGHTDTLRKNAIIDSKILKTFYSIIRYL